VESRAANSEFPSQLTSPQQDIASLAPHPRSIRPPSPHPLHDRCGVRHSRAAFAKPPRHNTPVETSASLARSPRQSVAPRTPPKHVRSNPKSPLTPVTLI